MKRAQLTVELFITSSLFVVVFDVDTLKVLYIVITVQIFFSLHLFVVGHSRALVLEFIRNSSFTGTS